MTVAYFRSQRWSTIEGYGNTPVDLKIARIAQPLQYFFDVYQPLAFQAQSTARFDNQRLSLGDVLDTVRREPDVCESLCFRVNNDLKTMI